MQAKTWEVIFLSFSVNSILIIFPYFSTGLLAFLHQFLGAPYAIGELAFI